jgi:hypothetical protein
LVWRGRRSFTPSTSTLDVLRATRETEQELEGIDQAIKAMPLAGSSRWGTKGIAVAFRRLIP